MEDNQLGISPADDFLYHKRLAFTHLKSVSESHDPDFGPALLNLRAAVTIGIRCLHPAVSEAAHELTTIKPNPALVPLSALYDATLALHHKIGYLNEKSCVIFDELWANQGLVLSAFAFYFGSDEDSAGIVGAVTCAECGTPFNLDEDRDNPGVFYCVPCWIAYGTSAQTSVEDKPEPRPRAEGQSFVTRYSLAELIVLRDCALAKSSLESRSKALGCVDAAAVSAIQAQMPTPWEGHSKPSRDQQRRATQKAKADAKKEARLEKARARFGSTEGSLGAASLRTEEGVDEGGALPESEAELEGSSATGKFDGESGLSDSAEVDDSRITERLGDVGACAFDSSCDQAGPREA